MWELSGTEFAHRVINIVCLIGIGSSLTAIAIWAQRGIDTAWKDLDDD